MLDVALLLPRLGAGSSGVADTATGACWEAGCVLAGVDDVSVSFRVCSPRSGSNLNDVGRALGSCAVSDDPA